METILTEEELKALCVKYQKILRLQDWNIIVRIKRARDFDQECCGDVHWSLTRKEAVIRILDHVDYDPDSIYPQNMERTLIHELLHIHFAEVSERAKDADIDIDTSLEQALQCIAQAFLYKAKE